ncbi:hypothetical protein RDB90_005545 [Salmonella enterica]|nr:hypothetical protein [Salmonella enterica]ELE1936902.1 hypothetical protein [Salmonella enterica]ELW8596594.1 hypothetical protein [Salmonella enterica]
MGRKSPRHGAVVRGRTQKFLTPAAKSFVAGTSHPGRLKRDVVISAPGKSGGGEQAAEVAAEGKNQRRPALRLTPRLLHRRGAMSAGYGAKGRRIRLRMLQAGFSAIRRENSIITGTGAARVHSTGMAGHDA